MAVLAEAKVFREPYQGWEEPQFPVGMWKGQASVIGDATGGLSVLSLIFQPATGQRTADLYSLDEYWVRNFENAGRNWVIDTTNFGILDLPASGAMGLFFVLESAGNGVDEAASRPRDSLKHWWLGRQVNPLVATSLRANSQNVNLITNTFSARGYIWSVRSATVPGGPQRPPQGYLS